jgi:hypothetical protein
LIHFLVSGVLRGTWITTERAPVRLDDDLQAMDATRRYGMDDKTFDSLLKLTATSTGRRRLFQAVAAVGVGSLLTSGVAGAQEFVAAACQNRQTKCNRNRQCQCKSGRQFENVTCDRLRNNCNKNGDRCCGVAQATCDRDCDCCRGYQCNQNRNECVRT